MTAVKTALFYSPVSGQITCEEHAPTAPVAKAIADRYGLRVTDLWPVKGAA